jgi:hypothetical protein
MKRKSVTMGNITFVNYGDDQKQFKGIESKKYGRAFFQGHRWGESSFLLYREIKKMLFSK